MNKVVTKGIIFKDDKEILVITFMISCVLWNINIVI
ncbi:MAG: hypothetical protein GX753_04685 [Erysipelothrix sp.]|nr:hypothetical protein [Erysipelothrix sp.]